jgi:hypothetical protein
MTLSLVYYLLYKVKSSLTLWIVNIYETISNDLIEYVENFHSLQEVYYLVSSNNSSLDIDNIKQFTTLIQILFSLIYLDALVLNLF